MRKKHQDGDYEVGHGRPPASTRFRKGESGNPRGRPKGRRILPPYEAVLGRIVVVRERGVERRITAAEAFLLQMVKRGLDGDGITARVATMIENAQMTRRRNCGELKMIVRVIMSLGSVNSAVQLLGLGVKLDRYRSTARMALEPFIVEEALSRMGSKRFSREEQAAIVDAVRTPKKVKWPGWWTVRPWH